MPLPTLFTKGAINVESWMTPDQKNEANSLPAVDFVVNYISERMPVRKSDSPSIPIKSGGDKVLLLESGTGSGKSTVLPPALYDTYGANICVTQPRVYNAINIPDQICEHNSHIHMGRNIGYQSGLISKKPTDRAIIAMTVGVLAQQLNIMEEEKFLKKYRFIIIDECHVRSTELDLTLYYLYKLLKKYYDHPDCPMLILMSATFDHAHFAKYFGCPKQNFLRISGKTYPIIDNFLEYDVKENIQESAIDRVKQIHTVEGVDDVNDPENMRDILIFVQGGASLRRMIFALHELNNDKAFVKHGYIAPIKLDSEHFKKSGKDYKHLIAPIEMIRERLIADKSTDNDIKFKSTPVIPVRKVFVGTDLAETGITIDTLKYCIDTGYHYSAEYNPVHGVRCLILKPITKGSATQRRGRVGRKAPGIWYPLYTEETFNKMIPNAHPDILRNSPIELILNFIIKESEKPSGICFGSISMLDMPSSDAIIDSLEQLRILGFIRQENKFIAPSKSKSAGKIQPTELGIIASKIRKISLPSIRMIFAGYHYGANILDLITIACMIDNFRSFFKKQYINKYKTPRNPLKLRDEETVKSYYRYVFADEFLECLWIWLDFMNAIEKAPSDNIIDYMEKYCDDNDFVYSGLLGSVATLRDEIIQNFIAIGINPFYNGLNIAQYNLLDIIRNDFEMGITEIQKIKRCILDGYRHNLCILNPETNKYHSLRKRITLYVTDSMLLKKIKMDSADDVIQNQPKYIIASELGISPSRANPSLFSYGVAGLVSVMDGFATVDYTISI